MKLNFTIVTLFLAGAEAKTRNLKSKTSKASKTPKGTQAPVPCESHTNSGEGKPPAWFNI